MQETPWDVLVIGAGISGLTAAYTLHQQGASVAVLEASARVGGMIQSVEENGFLYEAGPNTFPSTASAILELCQKLNLQPQAAQAAHRRYLYLNETLTALPTNPWEAITSPVLSTGGKLRLLQEPFISKTTAEDISIAEFFARRLGTEVVEHLIDPFISGIYAGNIHTLSLPAVFPKLWEWEQAEGSLLKGAFAAKKAAGKKPRSKMQLLSFSGGLQTLTNALAQALPSQRLHFNQTITRIERNADEYIVQTASGKTWQAAKIILATPANVSGQLLHHLAPSAREALQAIHYVNLSVVQTGFHRQDIPVSLEGFGFLIPRKEQRKLLGCIWVSSLFPERVPQGHVLLSNFIGGAHYPEVTSLPTEQIQQIVLDELQTVFKSQHPLKPVFCRVLSYPSAIPQYQLGHRERIQHIETALQALPGLALCGNYLHGIALNQCVQSGLDAVKNIS